MATKTVTIDTGEWKYLDHTGIPHVVTNAQTFTLTLTDGGIAAVTLAQNVGTSITTTDGGKITFRPKYDGGNQSRNLHTFTDAEQNTVVHNKRGEISAQFNDGPVQHWRIATIKLDDSDTPTLISSLRLEDQFGNVMNLPSTGSGWTVA